jgi:hypothetical protein
LIKYDWYDHWISLVNIVCGKRHTLLTTVLTQLINLYILLSNCENSCDVLLHEQNLSCKPHICSAGQKIPHALPEIWFITVIITAILWTQS